MTHDDLIKYFRPAAAACFPKIDRNEIGQNGAHYLLALDKALGRNMYKLYYTRKFSNDGPIRPQTRELLRKLAGPHGKTILKMYRIQKGWE